MSRARFPLIRLLLICLTVVPTLAVAQPGAVGTPAADFNLPVFGGGGSTMTLSQYSGKVVVLFIIGYG